jgi:hypothetical protein
MKIAFPLRAILSRSDGLQLERDSNYSGEIWSSPAACGGFSRGVFGPVAAEVRHVVKSGFLVMGLDSIHQGMASFELDETKSSLRETSCSTSGTSGYTTVSFPNYTYTLDLN